MPIYKTIYDRGCPELRDADGKVTQQAVEANTELVRDSLTAAEAIRNDRDRYSYKPWKDPAPGVSAKDNARAVQMRAERRAADKARAEANESEGEPEPE